MTPEHTWKEYEQSSPEEKIYPLNFVCQYVMKKRDELARLESQSVHDILQIRNESERIRQLSQNLQKKHRQGQTTDLEELQEIHAMQEKLHLQIEALSISMTEKGFVFENMNNMLQQTEYLISRLIFRDNLTTAYNRYFFVSRAEQMFQDAQTAQGLSMAFIDIDNFKQFNTNFGHDFGDQVLQQLSHLIDQHIQSYPDTYLIRMGGDEFILLSDGTMTYTGFTQLLERIRSAIAAMTIQWRKLNSQISISIGAANALKDHAASYWELYRQADDRLYRAKERGKNILVYAN